jgi:putative ABC transport system permease protein
MTGLTELWSDLRYRVRALLRRNEMERELNDELRFHLEREAQELVREGVPADEAMRRARVAFGAVESVKDASRDGRGTAVVDRIAQDFRYAWRALRRTPGFSVAVILTLGLGIGANAAMFRIVDRLLFRTPAYLRDPEMVHRVYLSRDRRGTRETEGTTEYTRYLDFRRWATSFSDMAGYSNRHLAVGTGSDAREMLVATVSAQLFDFFDAEPVVGRFFTPAEDSVPVGATVAVLGYGYWQATYGGSAQVLGQTLEVGTVDYTIIGVAPRDFVGVADEGAPAVFVPITTYAGTFRGGSAQANYYTRYNWGWMNILARRKPGVPVAAASADLTRAYIRSWNNEVSFSPGLTPAELAKPQALAGPVQTERGPNQSKVTKVAGWVVAVTVIVLLIACANVANLMLARAIRRRREIAVRLALGVSRGRLVLQLLTECLLLAAGGGLAGLLVAHWGGTLLRALFLPELAESGGLFDGRTLLFSSCLTLLAGTLTGLAPVLQSRRTDLVTSLKAGTREGVYRRSRVRSALLLLQAGLSVLLLIGAGLFVRSLQNVRHLRLGYDVDSVLYIYPNMRGVKLGDPAAAALRTRLADAARAIPGVVDAARGLTVPFWDTWTQGLFVSGIDSVDHLGSFTLQAGDSNYFRTVGTRILRGRGIVADDRQAAPKVAMVTQAMARKLWPGQEPLGQCMRMDADTAPCVTIVGVTEDMKQNSLTGDAGLHYYMPIDQFHPEAAVIFARVRGSPEHMRETVRRQLQPLMPGDGYLSVTPMRDIVGELTASWSAGATMFLAFGGLALILAAIGLYSVIAYDVAQRTHELGVRIALGARLGDVVRLVVGDGLRIASLGVALGGMIALWAGPWIEPLLFDQSPRDPVIFGGATAVLLVAAVAACLMPALRGGRVDPNVALRVE